MKAFNDSNNRWRVETVSGGSADQLETRSRLSIDRLDANSNGLYECEADTATGGYHQSGSLGGQLGADQSGQAQQPGGGGGGERLRKLFGLIVNGK